MALASIKGEEIYTASQWRLMWMRFKKHKVAILAGVIVVLFYLVAALAEFFAPYDPYNRDLGHVAEPPMRIHFWDKETGNFHLTPFVYATIQERDPDTLRRIYIPDTTRPLYLQFFVRGEEYKLWGLFRARLHFFGGEKEERICLLGTDVQGRDLLTRIIYGTRISLSIGLIGVAMSFTLGIILGAISGYFGGTSDIIIQRIIEVLMSIPSLPLWMALSAAIPLNWPVIRVFFMITVILSLMSWTGMARVVRGKFLSLRDKEFVIAARVSGAGSSRVMFRHLVPSFLSHIIASASLSIPGMILGETSLSFLGIGLRAPAISWGVLLQDAQNVQVVAITPWILMPGIFVIVIVLTFNFLGDGLRDAADPYA